MKLSQVFAAAKKFLVLPEEVGAGVDKKRYICYAINSTHYSSRTRSAACRVVSDRLGDAGFLENWLEVRRGRNFRRQWERNTMQFRQKMQATRHAWLDSLIVEFAAKGD